MKTLLRTPLGAVLLLSLGLVCWCFVPDLARAQNPAADLLALINALRLNQGLHPYAVSAELTAAAQRHSDDMAATGEINHTGSDGSSSTQRILEAGYSAYEFGPVVSENIYGGTGGAEVPFNAWLEQSGARTNLLSEKYREVGIGVANDNLGRTFWTLNVGAQPNVLPVLINGGVTSVDTITVTLRLVPENVVPQGRGTAMGQPEEYRASTSPQFISADWVPWTETAIFVLDDTPGQQTVYVQLRDAAGRTTVSQASVTLTDPTATRTPIETLEPTTPTETLEPATPAVETAAPVASNTPTRTPRASLTPTQVVLPTTTPTATSRPAPTASMTPLPTATSTLHPSATATSAPTDTPTRALPPTETATNPPAPTALPTVAVAQPKSVSVGAEVKDDTEKSSLGSRLVPWAVGLQAIALMLGVYVALRRPSE